MILSAQTIRHVCLNGWFMIQPFSERTVENGMTFGLSSCGYDIRVREDLVLPPHGFKLASSIEHFDMPAHIVGMVKDKSSWARRGVTVQNTVIEPGWRGYLTLELGNHSEYGVVIRGGSPIAQIIFEKLDHPTEKPYSGKYQDQVPHPVPWIEEKG